MNIKEFFKGIIIGIAKIIPGLSGSVLMISFNLYDKAIYSITNFFSDIKKNSLFLLNLSLGIVIGIILLSNILNYFITYHYVYTTSLFIGLIAGGFPLIYKNMDKSPKGYLTLILSLIIMSLISFSSINTNYIIKGNLEDTIIFFISGLLEALGTIVPGISSTALLMLIGVYNIFLNTLSNLYNIKYLISTLNFLIPFSLGLFIGIILLSLIINYLFKNHRHITFSLILGVTISSLLLLVIKVIPSINNPIQIPISIILIIIGSYITKKI